MTELTSINYQDNREIVEANPLYFDKQSIHDLPTFDFRAVSLSQASCEQLAKIYESVRRGGKAALDRSGLRNLLIATCFDPIRGVYIPISPHVYLVGKLPTLSEQIIRPRHCVDGLSPIFPFGAAFFTNALVIPKNYGTAEFNVDIAPPPKLRLTNIGFLIVTLEYDCTNQAEFEEILSWSRGRKGDGGIETSPFAAVDRELCKLSDYRGYCIVLSGSRSIHFHCLFSTAHLKNARYDALAKIRQQTFEQDSALMENAHRIYWNHINAVFKSVLKPSLSSDSRLQRATQWRRTPCGIRILDKDSAILGLPKGTHIPQLVIRENIRTRASRGANDYLVPASFSVATPISYSADTPRHDHNVLITDVSPLISLLQDECRMEWGEYPKPIYVTQQHGDWVIKFRNHPADQKPSTIVIGQNRRLILNGRHDFGERQFYLSDHMSANETINHLARRTGLATTITPIEPLTPDSLPYISETTSSWLDVPILDDYSRGIRKHFGEPLSDKPLQELQRIYRGKLGREFIQSRDWSDIEIIQSGEGIGKTSKLLPILSLEAQDDAYKHNDDNERFAGFAFRSHKQAELKAQEFRNAGHSVVIWRPFWGYYKEACAAKQQEEISRDEFNDASPQAILLKIFQEQPGVFERLEHRRKSLWSSSAKFSAHSTILVMTHRAAQTWDRGIITRAWHHPNFDPFSSMDQHNSLRDKIKLGRVVLDDPEAEDFLYNIPESSFEFLRRQQERNPNWRNRSHNYRVSAYRRLKANKELPGNLFGEFENFDELMRLDLTTLDMVQVNFDQIPFGYDHTNSGIYRERHGDKYYIGPKRWLFAGDRHVTVLTTETLVMDAVVGGTNRYRHRGGQSTVPFRLALDHLPGIYPIKIPSFIDRRARKGGVTALAQEITGSNANAIVISDMVRGVDKVMNFQSMKGVNGLEANDVYIAMTCLSPAKYAELNVMGRWLDIPNIIPAYYQDQINQAVGRNRGFRQSPDRETKTFIITSRRLWKSVLSGFLNNAPRVQLYEIAGKPW